MTEVKNILIRNKEERMAARVNRICHNSEKDAFYGLREEDDVIPDMIYSVVENKEPKTILLIDDLTAGFARRFPEARIIIALTPQRVPSNRFEMVKRTVEKYYHSVGVENIEIKMLKDILEGE